MKIVLLGCPGDIGGANSEAWHTLCLWRGGGAEVEVIPTWGGGEPKWAAKCREIGCTVTDITHIKGGIVNVPNLPGSWVVSFCNQHLFSVYQALQEMKCKVAWLNCMTFWFPHELKGWRERGVPEALIYQSAYQRNRLEDRLRGVKEKACCGGEVRTDPIPFDPDRGHLIRGAFDLSEWDFSPTPRGSAGPFVLGKIARPDPDKWSSNLWPIYGRVQHPQRRALCMGINDMVANKLGPTPEWAEWRLPGAIPTRDYYRKIHCMLTVNGGAHENWSRAVLEAFAAGVPVVAQRQWGLIEQIEHGVTGFLGDSDEELAHWAATLAWDEPLRMRIVRQARERLETELAEPVRLWQRWEHVFKGAAA